MLSYKEYKLLNESLYGAFNLGIRNPATVGGIVSGSPINGTAAAEEAIEEAKKAKKMKKKMDGEMGDPEKDEEDDEVVDKVDASDKDDDEDEDEDHEDHDDEDSDEDDEDSDDDEDEDEDSEEDKKPAPDMEKKDFAFMKKKMKKKSKKEWSEFMSNLESMLEGVDDEEALTEVKKGLEMMKKGMEKGMKKKMGCGCEKKCGKYMNEEDQKWWDSVNSMVNSDPNQKNWDGGWSQVGEVQQAVREGVELKKNSKLNEGIWDSSPSPDYHGKPGVLKRMFVSPSNSLHKSLEKAIDDVKAAYLREDPRAPELEEDLYRTYADHPDGGGHMMFSRQQLRGHLWDSPSEGNRASLKAAMRDLGLDVPSHATHGYGHPGFDRDGNMLDAPDREWEKPGNTWNKGSAR